MALQAYLKTLKPQGLKPHAWYSPESDFREAFVDGDDAYAETVTPGMDVYRAMSDNRIVGFQVWGAKMVEDKSPTD